MTNGDNPTAATPARDNVRPIESDARATVAHARSIVAAIRSGRISGDRDALRVSIAALLPHVERVAPDVARELSDAAATL